VLVGFPMYPYRFNFFLIGVHLLVNLSYWVSLRTELGFPDWIFATGLS
jgi:hypothetical protein